MSLKDSLLAASIGATMVSCNHATYQHTLSDKPTTTSHALRLSNNERQEQQFQQNYRYLYNNVSGAWFSFGDEKKIRGALYEVASFSKGREVIANIPSDMSFGSTNFMPLSEYVNKEKGKQEKVVFGEYNFFENSLIMNSDVIEQHVLFNDELLDVKDMMFHELLHAYQKNKGISLQDDKPSVEQLLHAQKLMEAEAAGWNKALELTQLASPQNKYFLRPEEVRDFMKRDLVAEERKMHQECNQSFDEREFKKNDKLYYFQQTLISCRGNYDLAQKKIVGSEIKRLMKDKDYSPEWGEIYDAQAFRIFAVSALLGRVSKNGNQEAYEKMLKYYRQEYGLSPTEISNTLLEQKHRDLIIQMKNDMERNNLYCDVPSRQNMSVQLRKGSQR
ncbi:MAG: hypothetical protein IKV03_06620 [Alphaproteobacteria bacterium]|nr:hypothetical protein [Alphaproteobacteria bacterium]